MERKAIMTIMNDKEVKKLVLENEKEGKIVCRTIEGFMTTDIDEFIEQPTEGLLYDLNRGRDVVVGFLNDPKWVNDYAVALVIARLKERIAEYASKNEQLERDKKARGR